MSAKKITTIQDLITFVNDSIDDQVLKSHCLVSMIDSKLLNAIQAKFKSDLNSSISNRSNLLKIKSIGSVFGFCSPNFFCQTLQPQKTEILVFLKSI